MEHADLFIIVLLAWARSQPAALGPKKCNKRGVGPLLRELRSESNNGTAGPFSEARKQVTQVLEGNCRTCRRCEMGIS